MAPARVPHRGLFLLAGFFGGSVAERRLAAAVFMTRASTDFARSADMNRFALIATAAAALTFAGTGAALADDCTGHSHDTGTAVGAVAGAAIGGIASHSIVGAVAGAVVGGVAGNAIDRDQDCAKQAERENRDTHDAYNQGYEDRAAQEDTRPAPPPDVTVYREPGDPHP
jgi:hypothetical protein